MSDYGAMLAENAQTNQFLLHAAEFYQHDFFVLHPNFDYCHKEGKDPWNEDKIRTYHILKQSEHFGGMVESFAYVKSFIAKEKKEGRLNSPAPVLEAARSKVKEMALDDVVEYLSKASKQVDRTTFGESFRFYFSRDIANHLTKSYDQETKFIRHLAQQQVREAEELFR